MKTIVSKLPGILLAAAIAVPAWILGTAFPVIGSPVLGILFGMILAYWKRPPFSATVSDTHPKSCCSIRSFFLASA